MLSLMCFLFSFGACTHVVSTTEVAEEQAPPVTAPESPNVPSPPESGVELSPSVQAPTPEQAKAGEQQGTEEAEHEEEGIPVIVPKVEEPRKAYVEPRVRVLIFGDASSITIWSEKEMSLAFEDDSMKTEPGSTIVFRLPSARIAAQRYPVGVATFTVNEYEKAMECAETWKEKGYTVRVIKAGSKLVEADGSTTDTTVYWIALGSFKQRKEAEAFQDKLFDQGISCWVIDEDVVKPRGRIEIADLSGLPLAYADSRVLIVSQAPIKISDVPFGNGFWNSGNHEDRSFVSPLEVIVDKYGKLAVINELGLEEYVKGVVPVEIRLTAPDEALKAQAVAARTEAIAKLGIQHAFDPYDYCASQHCQEFGGLARRTARTDAAVDATRGQVLVCNGTLVDAVYSANCGGHTEDNENVWSSRPSVSLRGVSDLYSNPNSFGSIPSESAVKKWLRSTPRAYCSDPRVGETSNFRWEAIRSAKEMSAIVGKFQNVGYVKDIKVLRRGVSGRALSVRLVGSRRSVIVNKELEIRKELGGLKSSMFTVEVKRSSKGKPTTFIFHGGGWGHGVGMCQAGAEGMALRGFQYTEILQHYFSGAEIKHLYE